MTYEIIEQVRDAGYGEVRFVVSRVIQFGMIRNPKINVSASQRSGDGFSPMEGLASIEVDVVYIEGSTVAGGVVTEITDDRPQRIITTYVAGVADMFLINMDGQTWLIDRLAKYILDEGGA